MTVNTKPLDATVCFRIDDWSTENCGKSVVLPYNKDVSVSVTAKGHKTARAVTRISVPQQSLTIQLEPRSGLAIKVIGGIAAVVLAGILLSGNSDSEDSSPGTTTITLVPPAQ